MDKKKIVLGITFLIGLIVVLVWSQGGFHSKVPGGVTVRQEKKLPPFKIVKVQTVETPGEVTVSGTVASKDTAVIASRILGPVIELDVDAGDKVKKGQVLAKIDTRELQEKVAEAEAAVASAKADLTTAEADFKRYQALYETGSISQKDLDHARTKYETAQAAQARAQAAVDQARTNLSYGIVTAPFDGMVAQRDVNLGDLATPGRPLLTLFIPGTVELVAAVGEQYAPFLKERAPVTVKVPSLDLVQSSKIREVVPQRNVKTRTITVKAPLKEVQGLEPGLYGTLTFYTIPSRTLAVPEEAVQTVGQLESVRVFEQGAIATRYVKTGRTLKGGMTEILSGLQPGEKVVIEGR
jgi:RND family efflux transporter MFP subunit